MRRANAATGSGPFGAVISIGPHRLTADEPLAVGGLYVGPDPYEFLLAGLGASTVMTPRLHANRKGWPLSHIEGRIRHAARATDGAPMDVFDREIRRDGELSAEERSQLLAIADHCPVSRTLAAGVTLQTRLGELAAVGEATA